MSTLFMAKMLAFFVDVVKFEKELYRTRHAGLKSNHSYLFSSPLKDDFEVCFVQYFSRSDSGHPSRPLQDALSLAGPLAILHISARAARRSAFANSW
jgi:hypothetical protein